MKVGVLGTVLSTQVAIETLVASGLTPEFLATLPEEAAERHSDYVGLEPLCKAAGIMCFETENANDSAFLDELRVFDVDIIFVVGWSRLVGVDFRSLARTGVLGYHPTLLPEMRGRAALAWTIDLDVRRTGGTLFWLDDGVDTGEIFAQRAFELAGDEYLSDLMELQMDALRHLIAEAASKLLAGSTEGKKQVHENASFLALRRPADGEIDWSRDAAEIQRLVRAVSKPYPGAFTFVNEEKITIWRASVVEMPDWFALTGQLFTYVDGSPVVRCGDGLSLVLEDFDEHGRSISTAGSQPVLGRGHG